MSDLIITVEQGAPGEPGYRRTEGATRAEAEALGYPEAAIAAGEALALGAARTSQVRRAIDTAVGDRGTREGISTDGAMMLLVEMGRVMVRMAAAETNAEQAEAARPFADLVRPMLERIDAGESPLPYLIKGGAEPILAEVEAAQVAVAQVLTQAAQGEGGEG